MTCDDGTHAEGDGRDVEFIRIIDASCLEFGQAVPLPLTGDARFNELVIHQVVDVDPGLGIVLQPGVADEAADGQHGTALACPDEGFLQQVALQADGPFRHVVAEVEVAGAAGGVLSVLVAAGDVDAADVGPDVPEAIAVELSPCVESEGGTGAELLHVPDEIAAGSDAVPNVAHVVGHAQGESDIPITLRHERGGTGNEEPDE